MLRKAKTKYKKAEALSTSADQTLRRAINRAFSLFEPPERLTVSEWADKYRLLSNEETSRPGPWCTNEYAYMRKIMDSFNDDFIREIVLLKCTQIGGTEALLNMLGYTIDLNPSRILYVLPDEDIGKKFSTERIQKMFKSCAARFAGKIDERSEVRHLKFPGGFVSIASSCTPSDLASWSVPIVLLDEIDKYPVWSGREANPIKLAEERAKNWPIAKVVKVSTPTIKTGAIYKAYEEADQQYKYYVQCPHCGKYITLDFCNLVWPKDEKGEADPVVAEHQAFYKCQECGGRIESHHKAAMLRGGQWKPQKKINGRPRRVAFSINSLYSPWLSFGAVAVQFLTSKNDPENLMNFVNSWLGEPWEDKAATLERDMVLEKQIDIPEGVVPEWAQLLTGGVDVQKNGFYWVVDAWRAGLERHHVAHGWAETFDEVARIMDRQWPDQNGEPRWLVNLYAMDSGYNTEEVYSYAQDHGDACIPVKGDDRTAGRFTHSIINKAGAQGQTLYKVNGDLYKDMITAHMRRALGARGSWTVYKGCDEDYANQLTSENKIVTIKNGRRKETWVPKTSHADNHYLDASVYSCLAADVLNVRMLEEYTPSEAPTTLTVVEPREAPPNNGGFLNIRKGEWL